MSPHTISPYRFHKKSSWEEITESLISSYPLSEEELIERSHVAFDGVFQSRVGAKSVPLSEVELSGGTRGGIIGGFFEYLFVSDLIDKEKVGPSAWRFGAQNVEPDMVYLPDPFYSLEIKTSSKKNMIYGASSKAHKTTNGRHYKDGSGYYFIVNYVHEPEPLIVQLRFGWLDDSDWRGSKSAASAAANVMRENAALKLRIIYEHKDYK